MLSLPGSPEVHLDASDPTTLYTDLAKESPVTTDGDLVYTWEDISGNGHDVQKSFPTERNPFYRKEVINGLDALEFEGDINEGMFSEPITAFNTDLQTWFIVLLPGDRSAAAEFLWGQVYTSGFGGFEPTAMNIGTVNHMFWHYLRPYTEAHGGPRVIAPTVLSWLWAADNTVTLWNNGAGGFEGLTGKTASPAGHVRYTIGGRSDLGAAGFDGHIGELVGYASALSTADRIQAERYLCEKWGLDHLLVTTSQSLYSGSSPDDWLGRATIVKTAPGAWAATYREASNDAYDADDLMHIRFSEDEGATWGNEDTFTDGGAVTGFPIGGHSTYSAVGAVIAIAPNDDLLFWVSEVDSGDGRHGVYQYRSTDDGDTWSEDGQINSDDEIVEFSDYTTVGSDMYVVAYIDASADGTPPFKTTLYKSGNNGTSWSVVSDVTSTSDNTNEAGIIHLGGDYLLVTIRASTNANTYQRITDDLGTSWGTLTDIVDNVGVVHRPMLYQASNIPERVYMVGRSYSTINYYTSLWYTDDDGVTWYGPYTLHVRSADAAYATMMQRTNSSREIYIWSYLGTQDDADIWEIVAASYNEMSRSVVHPLSSFYRPERI